MKCNLIILFDIAYGFNTWLIVDVIISVIYLCVFQNDTTSSQDDGVHKTLLRRCLSHIKYLLAIVLIPPFLNYVALLQESTQLVPSGKHLCYSSRYSINNITEVFKTLYLSISINFCIIRLTPPS